MPREHANFVVAPARPFDTAARSAIALLRIATVAMGVTPRVISIEHLPLLVARSPNRESQGQYREAASKSSSGLRIRRDHFGLGRIFVRSSCGVGSLRVTSRPPVARVVNVCSTPREARETNFSAEARASVSSGFTRTKPLIWRFQVPVKIIVASVLQRVMRSRASQAEVRNAPCAVL